MRLIDADALLLDIERKAKAGFPANKSLTVYAESCVVHAPTVDAVPVLRGRWNNIGVDEFVCSNCGEHVEYRSRICRYAYCHKCGARMDLE